MKKYIKKLIHYYHPLAKFERNRLQCIKKYNYPSEILNILQNKPPQLYDKIEDLSFLVIDFETTGLNSFIDNILSIATTPIDNLTINISKSTHVFIKNNSVKKETVIINHIVPEMLINTSSLDDAMNELFKLMKNRILVAHGSNIEKRFIHHYLSTKYNITYLPVLWIDTLRLARSFQKSNKQIIPNYQLANIRKDYNLPEYISHNALIDTIATAELFLAELHHLFGKKQKTLGEIYKRSL